MEHEHEPVEGNRRDARCPSKVPLGDKGGIGGILIKLVNGLRLDVGELFWRGRRIARLALVAYEVRPLRGREERDERRLHHLLALHRVAYREVLFHDSGEDADEASPLALLGEVAEPVVDIIYALVDLVDVGVRAAGGTQRNASPPNRESSRCGPRTRRSSS